ncbi:hypothetical protein HDF24_23645 [Mucilaginibacter sp. X4EP1]|uniref:hypothetical protein n=1 Tax=Mucilaginibacter sp. X4EP1 TaxID=2723092 RepID=UPI002169FD90|nr:hypothetical protein [Mucilaginibacter sp. X4EP1]MCS3815928.1 hypothetical protein [Mucilaginibacter sp. X4EP1]
MRLAISEHHFTACCQQNRPIGQKSAASFTDNLLPPADIRYRFANIALPTLLYRYIFG